MIPNLRPLCVAAVLLTLAFAAIFAGSTAPLPSDICHMLEVR